MPHFNSLRCAKRFKKAGMPESLADAYAEVLADSFENMASKDDLRHLENGLNQKIAMVDTKLNWLMTLVGLIGFVLTAMNFWHVICH